MLDVKELNKSKQLKALIDEAMKSPKGTGDLFIGINGKTYKLVIELAKK